MTPKDQTTLPEWEKEAEELYPHATVGTPEEIQWANSFQDAKRLVHIDARRKSAAELSELREQLRKSEDYNATLKDLNQKWQKVVSQKNSELAEVEAYYCSQGLGLYPDTIKTLRENLSKAEEQLKALQEADRWIPVNERLPERNRMVLVIDDGRVDIANCPSRNILTTLEDTWEQKYPDHTFDCADWHLPSTTVTHWRPLPQPPKNN